jgi:thiol:disulfide interchange protein DsbA
MTLRPALFRGGLLLASLLALSACNNGSQSTAETAAPAPAATAPAADATATPPAADASPAPAATDAARPAQARPPQGPAPVAGRDYVEISGGTPFAPAAGKVEVVEIFGYTCPHCAAFEPALQGWKAQQPTDVNVVPVPAPFGGYWVPYAKAYYAAEALGLAEKTHQPMFNAIHVDRSLSIQPPSSNEEIAAFYAKHGANAQQFAATMESFAVNGKLKRAMQFITRSGVDATPMIVVAGKYRVTGQSPEDSLRIAEHLIARERAAAAPAAAAPAAAAPAPAGG